MRLNYFLLDVFTDQPFCGNPLAVFPDADPLKTEQMQAIAGELNLSETTFIQRPTSADTDCTVRIFTPRHEMPMAGHPTIGTAWTILKHQLLKPHAADHLMFDEGVGPVRVDVEQRAGSPWELVMHQPLPEFLDTFDKEFVAALLSLTAADIAEQYPVQVVTCGVPITIVPLASIDATRRAKLRPDLLESHLRDGGCGEVLIFARETEQSDADVHCRFFAPRLGVPEDAATGAAHGPLGSYLVQHGILPAGRIVSEQGIEMGRPSRLNVQVATRDDRVDSVCVGGRCVAVGEGALYLEESSTNCRNE